MGGLYRCHFLFRPVPEPCRRLEAVHRQVSEEALAAFRRVRPLHDLLRYRQGPTVQRHRLSSPLPGCSFPRRRRPTAPPLLHSAGLPQQLSVCLFFLLHQPSTQRPAPTRSGRAKIEKSFDHRRVELASSHALQLRLCHIS